MSTASTSLSTRVDARLKAKFIERAAELGLPPSQLLKRIVEEQFVERPSQEKTLTSDRASKSKGIDQESLARLTLAAKGIGAYKMRRCKHNVRGVCHLWAWDEKPQDASVSTARCEDGYCWAKGRYHVGAHSERCAICDSFKSAEAS